MDGLRLAHELVGAYAAHVGATVSEVWRAFKDESLLVFKDFGVMLIAVIAVVIYSFFYPVPYEPEVLHDIPLAVVDADQSAMSRTYVRMVDAHESLRVATTVGSVAEAERLIKRGEVAGAIVIPRGMERDVLRGKHVTLTGQLDASYMLVYSHVFKGVLETTGTMSAGVEIARYRAAGKSAEAAARARQPIVAELRPLFSPVSGYGTYVIPAVLILVLQQTLLIAAGMAGGTRYERDVLGLHAESPHLASSFDVLTPLWEVLGRSVPYILVCSANVVYCFGFVLPYHGYPLQGAGLSVLMLAVPFVLATTMMGLALRGLFRRRETSVQVLLFTSLPLIFLGGFSWPVEVLPSWLQFFSRLSPTSSAIPGFLRIVRMGAALPDVTREATTLWILALLYFPFACWSEAKLLRRRHD
jgi:ABC-2 type transport system permease protein